jgi:hypothetical protein
MRRAHSASILSRERMIGRAACVVAVLALLAAPGRSPAQDAGVSGIPPGPANARGLNGSLNDPSGVGNAARVPALPQQIRPVPVPTLSAPVASSTLPVGPNVKIKRTRYAASRWRHLKSRAAVRKQSRLTDYGTPSICRGC